MDDLFHRAEKARREAVRLSVQFDVLQVLRALDRDFRAVTANLARAMERVPPTTRGGIENLLRDADEIVALPPPRD